MEMCEKLKQYDYVYHIDSDMKMVSTIGKEILGQRVCIDHPGYFDNNKILNYPYDRTPGFNAYVPYDEINQKKYYQNCLQGGSSAEFIKMAETIKIWLNDDIRQNFIPIWHDESYMNRYMIDNPPDVILSPSYAYPEHWQVPVEKKIIHLHKNHYEIRK